MKLAFTALFLFSCLLRGAPVEVLRDRWGVPHIYARNTRDLFWAQGYMAARDRLFQLDLWRRAGTGKLAEAVGVQAVERDRLARAVRYRGDWAREWSSYGSDTREIAVAFVDGVNAYIKGLKARPPEFAAAGFDPGLWTPEDVAARVAGLAMVRNISREVQRAGDIREFGLETVRRHLPVDPPAPITVPEGLDLTGITPEIVAGLNQVTAAVRWQRGPRAWLFTQPDHSLDGSNNWVVDGSMSATGKPILANDPHRPINIPSLRKTVHLSAPGWNAIGAGEPALPGIALGHNDEVGFGFTIVGIDQADLYVETLNPANPNQYRYRGAWREMEIETQTIGVRGGAARTVEIRYTLHGPVIHEDRARRRAYALKWIGAEPGAAGYLAGLALMRARNWSEFRAAVARYKVPSENLVYADRAGNIGWHASGATPLREGWNGLLPVPGESGKYEWRGFLPTEQLPRKYNPPEHYIATANHNILPPKYAHALGFEWALPFRYLRIKEILEAGPRKFTVDDFARLQQDVVSLPAREFQLMLRRMRFAPAGRMGGFARQVMEWDGALTADSAPAAIWQAWMAALPERLFEPRLAARVDLRAVLNELAARPEAAKLEAALAAGVDMLEKRLGPDPKKWTWGALHRIRFTHPLDNPRWDRGPLGRPGDSATVNAAGGTGFLQTSGASFRQILDLSDWDKSIMTNVPGESGDPDSPHYSDLLADWAAGRYHPMPFSRKAVEAAAVERLRLDPR